MFYNGLINDYRQNFCFVRHTFKVNSDHLLVPAIITFWRAVIICRGFITWCMRHETKQGISLTLNIMVKFLFYIRILDRWPHNQQLCPLMSEHFVLIYICCHRLLFNSLRFIFCALLFRIRKVRGKSPSLARNQLQNLMTPILDQIPKLGECLNTKRLKFGFHCPAHCSVDVDVYLIAVRVFILSVVENPSTLLLYCTS